MRLPKPLHIDLLELFRTGRFDCLRIGQSKELILHNFPDPDAFGPWAFDRRRGAIWRYGNVELHFDGDELCMIFSDYVATLDGGPSLALDCWILSNGAPPSLGEMIAALNTARIDFSKKASAPDVGGLVTLTLASRVQLVFHPPWDQGTQLEPDNSADQNELRMSAFSLRRNA